jgi:DNA-binding NarL/FixJ family response regulator
MVLRVVFAEDNFLVRQGTAALLGELEEIELVAVVEDPVSLLAAVDEHGPDAVLTDIRMPPSFTTEGIDAAKRIRAEHPGTGVVVLSQYVEEDYAFDLLQNGVAAWATCSRSGSPRSTSCCARSTRSRGEGPRWTPRSWRGFWPVRPPGPPPRCLGLTDREREVLQEMATGRSNASIAKTLYMSERAVEKHITSLFQKLGLSEEGEVNRRVSAVLAFLDAGGRPLGGR